MKLFKILTAVVAQTKATADQPSQDYLACTVTVDNTLAQQELEAKLGRKIFLSQGGQSYRYAVLSSDASYPEIKAWLDAKAADPNFNIPFLVDGDVHEVQTDRPYYVINPRTNKPVVDAGGKQQISHSISFFCPSGNSATTAARRIQRTLQFVEVTEATEAGEAVLA
jgi:hypothetical protein